MFQLTKKTIWGSIAGIFAILCIAFAGTLIEDVGGNDIVIIKAIGTGNLKFVTTPGWTWQGGGEVTHIPKSFQYWFSRKSDQEIKTTNQF